MSVLKIISLSILTVFLVAFSSANLKNTYKSSLSASAMTIAGTSNIHGWTIDVKDFACDMTIESLTTALKIESVGFRGKVKSFESGNNQMNKKMLESLEANKYPEIRFVLKSASNVSFQNNKFNGTITGDLSVAGKTRAESIQFRGDVLPNSKMKVTGSKKLKMSDFGIKPPTAMFGAMKTGDEVTVNFDLVLE
jgi:polyisoprenoid-binding protein YceI